MMMKSRFPLLKGNHDKNTFFKAILSLEMHSLGSKVTIVVISSVNGINQAMT